MNVMEGMRRLALLLGVVGAIFGGIFSYVEFQNLLNQKARHDRFEQLANSDVVQRERKAMSESEGRILFRAPDGTERWVLKDEKDAALRSGGVVIDDGETATINGSGIISFRWDSNYRVESIETGDGQILYRTPAPNRWHYLFAAILPLFGFALPWGLIRAVAWVGAGFSINRK